VTILQGESVRLRPATLDDVPELARVRATPEVQRRWRGGDDMVAAVLEDFREQDTTAYVIELDGRVVGWIQWQAEEEPDYRHASMDIYVDPAVHGRGVGTDAVRTLARHLIDDHGYHRLTIDPAADNAAAIRAYTKPTRTIPAKLRKALEARYPTCGVRGCANDQFLEIDHVVPVADRGCTEIGNVWRLCSHHHRLKTYGGWIVIGQNGDRDLVPPDDPDPP